MLNGGLHYRRSQQSPGGRFTSSTPLNPVKYVNSVLIVQELEELTTMF